MKVTDLPRFYSIESAFGKSIHLDEEESRHAKVLRLKEGDVIHVINGKGSLFEAKLIRCKKVAEVQIGAEIENQSKSDFAFWLAVAPTKNMARFEWVIEKSVEMGVSRISPIVCQRSERVHLKLERLQKIAISAMKQSKGLWLPEIDSLASFNSLLESQAESKWIAHCESKLPRKNLGSISNLKNQLVCIGPEGDFTPEEIELAYQHGFLGLSLGNQRLRTETAAVSVCVAGLLLNQSAQLPSDA